MSDEDAPRPRTRAAWAGDLQMIGPPPEITIGLTPELRHGIAEQMRALADLIDPPKDEVRVANS